MLYTYLTLSDRHELGQEEHGGPVLYGTGSKCG